MTDEGTMTTEERIKQVRSRDLEEWGDRLQRVAAEIAQALVHVAKIDDDVYDEHRKLSAMRILADASDTIDNIGESLIREADPSAEEQQRIAMEQLQEWRQTTVPEVTK